MQETKAFDKGSDLTIDYITNILKSVANEDENKIEYTDDRLNNIRDYAQLLHDYVAEVAQKSNPQGKRAQSIIHESKALLGLVEVTED